jgi:hypothetical protein
VCRVIGRPTVDPSSVDLPWEQGLGLKTRDDRVYEIGIMDPNLVFRDLIADSSHV